MLNPQKMPNWATEAETKVGDRLVADGGFTCLGDGEIVTVFDHNGALCVSCSEGRHILEGQLENGRYVGLTKAGDDVASRAAPGSAAIGGSTC